MTWDKTRPQGSEKIRNSDDLLRENNQALEDALSEGHEFETGGDQSGKHVSPTFKDVGSDPDQPTSTNEIRLYNKEQVLYTIDDSGATRGVNRNTDIPSGTKMLFKQGSAPSGWTFKSEDNDRALINTSTEGDGGQTGGDWEISGLSISVGDHSLTVDEIPSHSHSYIRGAGKWHGSSGGDTDNTSRNRDADTFDTNNTGGGNAHNHSGSYSHDGNWRPRYVKIITCSKQ